MTELAVGSLLWLIMVAFGAVLAICWLVLPFALIGTKPLLRELVAETRRTNTLLEQRSVIVPPA